MAWQVHTSCFSNNWQELIKGATAPQKDLDNTKSDNRHSLRRRISEGSSRLHFFTRWRPQRFYCLCCQQSWSLTANLGRVSICPVHAILFLSLCVNGRYRIEYRKDWRLKTISTMSSSFKNSSRDAKVDPGWTRSKDSYSQSCAKFNALKIFPSSAWSVFFFKAN